MERTTERRPKTNEAPRGLVQEMLSQAEQHFSKDEQAYAYFGALAQEHKRFLDRCGIENIKEFDVENVPVGMTYEDLMRQQDIYRKLIEMWKAEMMPFSEQDTEVALSDIWTCTWNKEVNGVRYSFLEGVLDEKIVAEKNGETQEIETKIREYIDGPIEMMGGIFFLIRDGNHKHAYVEMGGEKRWIGGFSPYEKVTISDEGVYALRLSGPPGDSYYKIIRKEGGTKEWGYVNYWHNPQLVRAGGKVYCYGKEKTYPKEKTYTLFSLEGDREVVAEGFEEMRSAIERNGALNFLGKKEGVWGVYQYDGTTLSQETVLKDEPVVLCAVEGTRVIVTKSETHIKVRIGEGEEVSFELGEDKLGEFESVKKFGEEFVVLFRNIGLSSKRGVFTKTSREHPLESQYHEIKGGAFIMREEDDFKTRGLVVFKEGEMEKKRLVPEGYATERFLVNEDDAYFTIGSKRRPRSRHPSRWDPVADFAVFDKDLNKLIDIVAPQEVKDCGFVHGLPVVKAFRRRAGTRIKKEVLSFLQRQEDGSLEERELETQTQSESAVSNPFLYDVSKPVSFNDSFVVFASEFLDTSAEQNDLQYVFAPDGRKLTDAYEKIYAVEQVNEKYLVVYGRKDRKTVKEHILIDRPLS
jgi:hypothetical protein